MSSKNMGQAIGGRFSERAASSGTGLEVANAIRDYLTRAGGDPRLALALSVADAVASSQRQALIRRPKSGKASDTDRGRIGTPFDSRLITTIAVALLA